jgi:hypothetical protein
MKTRRSAAASLLGTVLLSGMLALAPPWAAAVEVVNGGFETGDFRGWSAAGLASLSGVDAGAAHSGTFGAYFGDTGTLSQALATTASESYSLSFWLRTDGLDANPFYVTWNGTSVFEARGLGAFDYRSFMIAGLTSSTPLATLTFGFRPELGFVELDDISVVSVIPEPETWALMLGGLAGLLARRNRRLGRAAVLTS